ncbi:MAG: AAA family ATPase [Actinomycetota bacterium]
MSVPEDNVVERGRAIFEQLRSTPPPDLVEGDGPGDGGGSEGAAEPSPAGASDGPEHLADQSAGPERAPATSPAGADGPPHDHVAELSAAGTPAPDVADHSTAGPGTVPAGDGSDQSPPAVAPALDTTPAGPASEPVQAGADLVPDDAGGPPARDGFTPTPDAGTGTADVAAAAHPETDQPGAADGAARADDEGGSARSDPTSGATAPVDGAPPATPVEVDTLPPPPERGPVPLGIPPDAVATLLGPSGDAADHSPARFARPLPRVMAIANQKGGVGKTTTAVNLGAGFAELGHRVLVVDLDPQGNATTGLGINPRNLETSVYDVMMHDVPLDDCIEPTALRNLFVCPATIDLAGAEIELVPAFSRELKLRRALEQVLEDFDFVVIDCPPSLGLITVNALAAATEVVVPIQCEYYALEGLGQLLRNVKLVQTNLNPRLEVSAIVLTMFDARTKLADQVATEVRNHFGPKVCRNIVPRTVRLSEAPSFGQPILVFDPTSRGAIAYRELAKEVSGGAPQRVG